MAGLQVLQGGGGPPQFVRIAVVDYYTASLAAQGINRIGDSIPQPA
mgnify:CR=1 FL=1